MGKLEWNCAQFDLPYETHNISRTLAFFGLYRPKFKINVREIFVFLKANQNECSSNLAFHPVASIFVS